MKRGGFKKALALLALPAVFFSASARAEAPRPETFALANGMQVVVISDRRAPVVTHQVWYRVGAADEPRGRSGIAHFLEHLMFKGTPRIPPGEFSKTVARNGGDDNAQTSWDYTSYYERIARDRLELVMRMEADRMRNLRLAEDDIASERDVIVEERRQRTDNNPGAVLGERMRAMLYPHHPYGTPIIGWLHEMRQLSRQDALDFYKLYYAPNNAILVIAGDVNAAEVRPLAERYYGRLRPTRDLPARVWAADPPNIGPMRVSHTDEKVRQPSLTRLYPSISYTTGTGRQAHALDVAAEILGGSETSRLYRALVEDQRIAVAAGAGADSSGIGGGTFTLYGSPSPGVPLDRLESAIDQVVQRFLAEGPTDSELERAKSNLAAAATYARDSQESLAFWYGSSLAEGETLDQILAWPDEIKRVTKDEVMAVLRATLDINSSVTGYLLPPAASASSAP
ncbi:MAG: insulinase family protein [Hyphomonadaceae bacterium]|nr:insulinase family protein [Hyphomonadaceae bacterium]